MSEFEDALWVLAMLEAFEGNDDEAVAALLSDLPVVVVAGRLAGAVTGLVIQLCMNTGISPGEWLANVRADLIQRGAA